MAVSRDQRDMCGWLAHLAKAALLLLVVVLCGDARDLAAAQLHWRNGDAIPGELVDGDPASVRWRSPYFQDELVLDVGVLESVVFPKQAQVESGPFRVITVTGDIFTADIISADAEGFVFGAGFCEPFRVRRDEVYAIDRVVHPLLVFDGSQSSAWGVALPEGPIKDLEYRVYDGREEWPRWTPGVVPDMARLIPATDGGFAAGYIDLGLTDLTDDFAMVFSGQLEATRDGEYSFVVSSRGGVKLFVDGTLVGLSATGKALNAVVALEVGFHTLRVEYGKVGERGAPALDLRWSGPAFRGQSLVGINPPPAWYRGEAGHLRTDRYMASIFRGMDLPDSFVMEVELAFEGNPSFVLGLGGDASNLGTGPQPLRVETWENELVILQNNLFETLTVFQEGTREVSLWLAYDAERGRLSVRDGLGRKLADLDGVRSELRRSGLFLRNRSEEMTVRRLRVYPLDGRVMEEVADPGAARVHLADGRILYGQLMQESGVASVGGRVVELGDVDRVVLPERRMVEGASGGAVLMYSDGSFVRGSLEDIVAGRVRLRPSFVEDALDCRLDSASRLTFGVGRLKKDKVAEQGWSQLDELRFAAGHLRGTLTFERSDAPFAWRPEGALEAVRLGNLGGGRVERWVGRVGGLEEDVERAFPHRLHLVDGEVLPCLLGSYGEGGLSFASPFASGEKVGGEHVLALEFAKRKTEEELARGGVGGRRLAARGGRGARFGVDPVRLERALTVPRFSRENPPRHLLISRLGDIKRGELKSLEDGVLVFESRKRVESVPVDRVAVMVGVGVGGEGIALGAGGVDFKRVVRVDLVDDSVMVFAAERSDGRRLMGTSLLYGAVAIPVEHIRRMSFGDFQRESLQSEFSDWVMEPAVEPGSEVGGGGEGGMIAPVPAEPVKSVGDGGGGLGEVKMPDLGLVRVDPVARSVSFPVSVNQRSGLIEYAVVTGGGKTHESLFKTEAEPTQIHLGLLLLGGKPVYERQLPVDTARQLPGEKVLIEVVWGSDGSEHVVSLESLIVTTNDAEALVSGPWVYNGSVMEGKGLAAQREGSVVSLQLDPLALVNNPRPGRGNDELHRPNAAVLPGEGLPLEMRMRLARDGVGREGE